MKKLSCGCEVDDDVLAHQCPKDDAMKNLKEEMSGIFSAVFEAVEKNEKAKRKTPKKTKLR